METPGLETIGNLKGTAPTETKMPYQLLKSGEVIRQVWNKHYLAFIPYCYMCKVPVNWFMMPSEHTIFKCPECGRTWIRNDEWQNDYDKDTEKSKDCRVGIGRCND